MTTRTGTPRRPDDRVFLGKRTEGQRGSSTLSAGHPSPRLGEPFSGLLSSFSCVVVWNVIAVPLVAMAPSHLIPTTLAGLLLAAVGVEAHGIASALVKFPGGAAGGTLYVVLRP